MGVERETRKKEKKNKNMTRKERETMKANSTIHTRNRKELA